MKSHNKKYNMIGKYLNNLSVCLCLSVCIYFSLALLYEKFVFVVCFLNMLQLHLITKFGSYQINRNVAG